MLDRALFSSLLALNFIQIIWLFAYKKSLTFRESVFLSVLLVVQSLIGFKLDYHLLALPMIPFFFLQFTFSVRNLQNWLTPALFLSFEYAIVLLSWFLTLDFWDILFINHLISAETYFSYLNILIVLQQLSVYLLLSFITYVDRKYEISRTLLLITAKYRFLSILLLLTLSLIITLQRFSVAENYSAAYFYSSFMIVCFTAFLSWNVSLIIKRQNEQQYIAVLYKKYEQEKEKIEHSNEFRHDYKQLLIGLTSYLEINDTQNALGLLRSIIDYSNSLLTPNLYKSIAMINNPPIQGLLTSFLRRCSESDVQLRLKITEMLTDIDMNILDFIRCFSILLDNAYEAVQETETQFIEISISSDPEFVKITVKNTYNDTNSASFQSLLQNNFSTKKNHQGKGLHIFAKLINKYNKTSYQILKKDQYFITSFSVPKIIR